MPLLIGVCPVAKWIDRFLLNRALQNILITHFISLQIDIEKEEGPAFSTIYNVSLLPTLLFIDNKGTVIYSAQGFKSPSGLLELAKKHKHFIRINQPVIPD